MVNRFLMTSLNNELKQNVSDVQKTTEVKNISGLFFVGHNGRRLLRCINRFEKCPLSRPGVADMPKLQ